jgi:hypothetical protein
VSPPLRSLLRRSSLSVRVEPETRRARHIGEANWHFQGRASAFVVRC